MFRMCFRNPTRKLIRTISDLPEMKFEIFYKNYLKEQEELKEKAKKEKIHINEIEAKIEQETTDIIEIKAKLDSETKEAKKDVQELRIKVGEKFDLRAAYLIAVSVATLTSFCAATVNYIGVKSKLTSIEISIQQLEGQMGVQLGKVELEVGKVNLLVKEALKEKK